MPPRHASVVRSKTCPAILEAGESGIDGVALGSLDDVPLPYAVEGPDQKLPIRNLRGLDMRPDGWPTQFAERRQPIQLELAPALPQEQAEQRLQAFASGAG